MSKSRCAYCDAPRTLLDTVCPYCGSVYDDVFDQAGSGSLYEALLDRRGVIFETEAVKRWTVWAHTNCRLRLTRDELIFDDFEDETYSFSIPMYELQRANIESPRGFFGSSDDVLIIMEDGTEYEFGLDSGVKEKVLEIIQAIWESD